VRLVDAAPLQPGRSDRPRLDRDIDDDGYPDRLLSFRSDDLRLEPGSHEAALEGATFDGVAFVGRVPLEAVLHGNGIAGGKQGAKPSSTAPSGSIGYAAPAILSASFEVEGVRVRVGLPDSEIASLELFDVSGRRLAREVGHLSAGEHELQLLRTSRLGPGVYWVRLQQGTATDVERMIAVH